MKDLGYQEGRNITLDFRYGGVSPEHTDRLVADAVASKPDLIITQAGAVHTAAALTTTIPIALGIKIPQLVLLRADRTIE